MLKYVSYITAAGFASYNVAIIPQGKNISEYMEGVSPGCVVHYYGTDEKLARDTADCLEGKPGEWERRGWTAGNPLGN